VAISTALPLETAHPARRSQTITRPAPGTCLALAYEILAKSDNQRLIYY